MTKRDSLGASKKVLRRKDANRGSKKSELDTQSASFQRGGGKTLRRGESRNLSNGAVESQVFDTVNRSANAKENVLMDSTAESQKRCRLSSTDSFGASGSPANAFDFNNLGAAMPPAFSAACRIAAIDFSMGKVWSRPAEEVLSLQERTRIRCGAPSWKEGLKQATQRLRNAGLLRNEASITEVRSSQDNTQLLSSNRLSDVSGLQNNNGTAIDETGESVRPPAPKHSCTLSKASEIHERTDVISSSCITPCSSDSAVELARRSEKPKVDAHGLSSRPGMSNPQRTAGTSSPFKSFKRPFRFPPTESIMALWIGNSLHYNNCNYILGSKPHQIEMDYWKRFPHNPRLSRGTERRAMKATLSEQKPNASDKEKQSEVQISEVLCGDPQQLPAVEGSSETELPAGSTDPELSSCTDDSTTKLTVSENRSGLTRKDDVHHVSNNASFTCLLSPAVLSSVMSVESDAAPVSSDGSNTLSSPALITQDATSDDTLSQHSMKASSVTQATALGSSISTNPKDPGPPGFAAVETRSDRPAGATCLTTSSNNALNASFARDKIRRGPPCNHLSEGFDDGGVYGSCLSPTQESEHRTEANGIICSLARRDGTRGRVSLPELLLPPPSPPSFLNSPDASLSPGLEHGPPPPPPLSSILEASKLQNVISSWPVRQRHLPAEVLAIQEKLNYFFLQHFSLDHASSEVVPSFYSSESTRLASSLPPALCLKKSQVRTQLVNARTLYSVNRLVYRRRGGWEERYPLAVSRWMQQPPCVPRTLKYLWFATPPESWQHRNKKRNIAVPDADSPGGTECERVAKKQRVGGEDGTADGFTGTKARILREGAFDEGENAEKVAQVDGRISDRDRRGSLKSGARQRRPLPDNTSPEVAATNAGERTQGDLTEPSSSCLSDKVITEAQGQANAETEEDSTHDASVRPTKDICTEQVMPEPVADNGSCLPGASQDLEGTGSSEPTALGRPAASLDRSSASSLSLRRSSRLVSSSPGVQQESHVLDATAYIKSIHQNTTSARQGFPAYLASFDLPRDLHEYCLFEKRLTPSYPNFLALYNAKLPVNALLDLDCYKVGECRYFNQSYWLLHALARSCALYWHFPERKMKKARFKPVSAELVKNCGPLANTPATTNS